MRGSDRTAHVVGRGAAAVVITLLVAGCTPTGDGGVAIDLSQAREQLEQGVDEVQESADEARDAIVGANLDDQTRQAVDEAVSTSRAAMEEAQTAIAGASDDVSSESQAAFDDAAEGLADARQLVEAAAQETEGAVRAALEELAAQMNRLTARIRAA